MSKWHPEVMHFSFGADGTVCGAKNHTWPEHYIDEFVARKMARCNDCMEIVNQLKVNNKSPVKREVTQVMRVYLKDYLTI